MLNKSLFSAFFHALKSTNSFKNNHVTDVTAQFWLRLHENPFKINRVTDVTDVTAKKRQLDIAFRVRG
ncbi:MAG: hypothetical protein WAQ53_15375 [Thiofilum sp.]|uniref:hypothetical protein n=1 Tax=Thiofilum sp. TaxID=2212733 RepID=UPI0025DB0195|nr:hypothetical protein [Thiofilum sp.]MBK8451771.1 hypothetical protein [Thiofilum sp.]